MVPTRSGKPEARVYLKELAAFLSEPSGKLRKYAKKRGFLYYASQRRGTGRVYYVSEYGAMRLIAFIRAMQGELHIQGKPYFERREYMRLLTARKVARMKAEQASLNVRASLVLANPMAGTEDEGGQDHHRTNRVKPEAVEGNPGGVSTNGVVSAEPDLVTGKRG